MDKEPKQESGDFEKAKEAYSQFSAAMDAGDVFEVKKYIAILPSLVEGSEKTHDLYSKVENTIKPFRLGGGFLKNREEVQSALERFDSRLIWFDVCDKELCSFRFLIKQEYWGDDMGQSVIDEYKD